jgi:hypothetical protein
MHTNVAESEIDFSDYSNLLLTFGCTARGKGLVATSRKLVPLCEDVGERYH